MDTMDTTTPVLHVPALQRQTMQARSERAAARVMEDPWVLKEPFQVMLSLGISTHHCS